MICLYTVHNNAIRKVGTYVKKGYRQLFIKNFTILYRIDETNKNVIVVTVKYSRSKFWEILIEAEESRVRGDTIKVFGLMDKAIKEEYNIYINFRVLL